MIIMNYNCYHPANISEVVEYYDAIYSPSLSALAASPAMPLHFVSPACSAVIKFLDLARTSGEPRAINRREPFSGISLFR